MVLVTIGEDTSMQFLGIIICVVFFLFLLFMSVGSLLLNLFDKIDERKHERTEE